MNKGLVRDRKTFELVNEVELINGDARLSSIEQTSVGPADNLCIRDVSGTIQNKFEIFERFVNRLVFFF